MKKIRLHIPLLLGIEEALAKIFIEGKKSDHVVPAVLKAHPKWGSRDRNFVAENTYEIVRNKRLIIHCLDGSEAIHQMVGAWLVLKDLNDGSAYFNGLVVQEIIERSKITDPAIRYSVPDPLHEHMLAELGTDRWLKELEAMSQPAEVFVRVNVSRISRNALQEMLRKEGIESEEVPQTSAALRMVGRRNLTATHAFRSGLFEIQDAGSQMVSEYLAPKEGNFVIDACAGAGGKTLHLADLMRNRGGILAMDVEQHKLNELEARAKRNRLCVVKTCLVSEAVLQEYSGKADDVLLDVPCSGTGVIKRNPDAKEKLSIEFIANIREVQAAILEKYSKLVRPGGRLVYATCSLLPSENNHQVTRFLTQNDDFTFGGERFVWPSETGFDGFYMALLLKK